MNDREVRVRCIEAAARVPGNPNTVQQARAFYEFVKEGDDAEEAPLTMSQFVSKEDLDAAKAERSAKKPSRK